MCLSLEWWEITSKGRGYSQKHHCGLMGGLQRAGVGSDET